MKFDKFQKRILLSENDSGLPLPELNTIHVEGKSYFIQPIKDGQKITKGGNSTVFRLVDPENREIDKAIKFSNIYKPIRSSPDKVKQRYGRFITEIQALFEIRDNYDNPNVVKIVDDGLWESNDGKVFPYYIMEKANCDLTSYILENNDKVDVSERISLCMDLFNGIQALHKLDYYHRDIKPDNILVFYTSEDNEKFTWKIGDLGLVAHRERDCDEINEKIGPIGWLSPEAMNKYLTESSNLGLDCKIDECSDVFQLGKLFWFIFNCNVPIGQIALMDFRFEAPEKSFIFDLIFKMLHYSKTRRLQINEIEEYLYLMGKEFQLI